ENLLRRYSHASFGGWEGQSCALPCREKKVSRLVGRIPHTRFRIVINNVTPVACNLQSTLRQTRANVMRNGVAAGEYNHMLRRKGDSIPSQAAGSAQRLPFHS